MNFLEDYKSLVLEIKMAKKTIIPDGMTLKEFHSKLKQLRLKGFKPFIRGKGSGRIKLDFE